MEIFNSVKGESHKRVAVLTLLIIIWTLGISLLISVLSQIEELVQNSPVSFEDQSVIRSKIERLDIQSKLTREMASANKDLGDDYREALNYLKVRFSNLPNTREGFIELISLIGSGNENPYLRELYSTQAIGIIVETIKIENETYLPKTIYLVTREVHVELKAETSASDYPEKISYLAIQSAKDLIDNKVNVESFSTDKKIAPIIEFSDPKSYQKSFPVHGDNIDRSKDLIKLIMIPREGVKVLIDLTSEKSINKIYKNILIQLQRTEHNLNKSQSKNALLSEKMLSKSDGLESKLLSSTALFAVISFRASLIVVVFVSIGFILIRALSAELAQSRRLSCTQIGHSILTEQDVEKLPYVEQVISVVSGDKRDTRDNKSNQSDLPLAAQLVEKTGDAISKIVTRKE